MITTNFIKLMIKVFFFSQGYVFMGYTTTYFAITQNSIAYIMGYQDADNKSVIDGIVNSLLPIGAAFGATSSNFLVKNLKYRNTFLFTDLIGLIATFASFYGDLYLLATIRFVFGLLVGINSSITIQYICQFVPLSRSGFFAGMPLVLMLLGLTFGFVTQWIFLEEDPSIYDSHKDYGYQGFSSWRLIFGFPLITFILRILSLLFFYRTYLPIEYYNLGQRSEALKIIESQYQFEGEQLSKREEYVKQKVSEFEGLNIEENINITELFGIRYRRMFFVCIVLGICQQMVGINAVNYFASQVLSEMTTSYSLLNLANVLNGLFSMISTLICSVIINRYGRRSVLLIGSTLCLISLIFVTLSLFFRTPDNQALQVSSLLFLFLFIISFSMSLGPLFWVYSSEVLPQKALDIVAFLNWMGCALVVQMFPIVSANLGIYYNFGFYSIVCLVAVLVVKYSLVESKGLNKLEILQQYSIVKSEVEP